MRAVVQRVKSASVEVRLPGCRDNRAGGMASTAA